jgi:hypothetical protein
MLADGIDAFAGYSADVGYSSPATKLAAWFVGPPG